MIFKANSTILRLRIGSIIHNYNHLFKYKLEYPKTVTISRLLKQCHEPQQVHDDIEETLSLITNQYIDFFK